MIPNFSDTAGLRTRAVRFLGLTVFNVVLGQSLIALFVVGFDWSPVISNITAALIVISLGFPLCVKFIWVDANSEERVSQALAFLAMGLLGLVISSVTVGFITQRVDHVLAANLGSLLGYGLAWVLRFVVLERFVFTPSTQDSQENADGTTVLSNH